MGTIGQPQRGEGRRSLVGIKFVLGREMARMRRPRRTIKLFNSTFSQHRIIEDTGSRCFGSQRSNQFSLAAQRSKVRHKIALLSLDFGAS